MAVSGETKCGYGVGASGMFLRFHGSAEVQRHAPLALSHERPTGVSLEEDSEISTPLRQRV